jgi:CCR4-NOT transcription complex subunit 7/8
MMTSGLVLNPDIRWVTFHSSYDFAYLLRLLTCLPLPATETEFFDLLSLYFPTLYDIKYLMKSCENLQGGLQKVADQLQLSRIGSAHQAGSDSLLTLAVFFKMKELFFEDLIDSDKFANVLYGLGKNVASQQHQQHGKLEAVVSAGMDKQRIGGQHPITPNSHME